MMEWLDRRVEDYGVTNGGCDSWVFLVLLKVPRDSV